MVGVPGPGAVPGAGRRRRRQVAQAEGHRRGRPAHEDHRAGRRVPRRRRAPTSTSSTWSPTTRCPSTAPTCSRSSRRLQYDIKFVQGMGMLSSAGLFNCVFTGQGRIAITSHGQPVVLNVDQPTYADPQAAICWSASLQTGYHRADQLGLGTLVGRTTGEAFTMCFSGQGFVVVQPSEMRGRPRRPGGGSAVRRRRHARRPPRRLSRATCRRSARRLRCCARRGLAGADRGRSQAAASAKSASEVPGGAWTGRLAGAVSARAARGYEPRNRTSAQTRRRPMQRLTHARLGQVPGAVEEERVPPEPLAGRAATRSG